MKQESLLQFENFLKSFIKKNGKNLGERTIKGILTLAKFIDDVPQNPAADSLKQLYAPYLKDRNYPLASYALWLYLKYLDFDEKFIREVVGFRRKNVSALSDEEKLASSVLSKKELFYLVENVKNERDNLIIRFLYDTAARVSEMTSIKLKDLDFETSEVQLMGKGKKPRTVYFQKDTACLLKSYINANKIANPNDLLFKIKPMSVWYNLKKYGKEYLSRDLHPHMFRHSRLQHMADEGVDSFAIKSYAGHSDIGTTQIYVRNSKFQRKLAFYKAGNIWEDRT
jgi:site-specific recombinase XerC